MTWLELPVWVSTQRKGGQFGERRRLRRWSNHPHGPGQYGVVSNLFAAYEGHWQPIDDLGLEVGAGRAIAVDVRALARVVAEVEGDRRLVLVAREPAGDAQVDDVAALLTDGLARGVLVRVGG